MFVGAPLALAAGALGQRWLFFVGIAMLILALALPTQRGQTFRDRLSMLAQHLPGSRWFRSKGAGR